MEDTKVVESEKYRLRVMPDISAEDPREWDNVGTIGCVLSSYALGDVQLSTQSASGGVYNSWEECLTEEILVPNGGRDEVLVLPLYILDHSGITINTVPFSCTWDSGRLGWIYTTKERLRAEGYAEEELFERGREQLLAEVAIYDAYLRGEVYAFIIDEKTKCELCGHVDYVYVEGCGGFYGGIFVDCIDDMKAQYPEFLALFNQFAEEV